MKRWTTAAMTGMLLVSGACTSGAGGTTNDHGTSVSATAPSTAAASTTAPSTTTGPTSSPVDVHSAIPDGAYRTRPRTEQDLVRLGLTRSQIEFAKNVELWKKTIVYEIRISGDQFVLTAASDGADPIVADQGSFAVHGDELKMTYYTQTQPEYTMRFRLSGDELRLKLLDNPCAPTDPEHCADFLVRAAYEALPFKAVN